MPTNGAPAASVPARNGAFQAVPGNRPRRAVFDLSHEKKLTFDFGQLIPSMCLEMVPGDTFEISNELIVRFQAMLAPPLHELNATIHYFFVPNRLVWPKVDTSGNDWESFITGGFDGANAAVLPRWNVASGFHDVGSLWDYFGLPTWSTANSFSAQYPDAIQPVVLPLFAYNLIWNEYYRDETLQSAVSLTPGTASQALLYRNWTKDYFTSALPWVQRGTAPAFPISGLSSAVWTSALYTGNTDGSSAGPRNGASQPGLTGVGSALTANMQANLLATFNANTVSLANATTFNISDFRLNACIQRFMERNARQGVRYTEFLQGTFAVSPRDDRLQRPEYVGGVSQPVIFSEVLQTSSTASQPNAPGTMYGHGLTVGRNYVGRYHAVEYGYMIGLLSCMPVPSYQDGVPKMFSRVSKFDFYMPDFANLSEQAVLNQELYLANDSVNQSIFGYQARYNEYRYERNSVHGLFRTTLNYWHLGRIFSSRPALNSSFIQLGSTEMTSLKSRVAAVPSQPLLLASVGNRVRAVRPMPEYAEPGLYRV